MDIKSKSGEPLQRLSIIEGYTKKEETPKSVETRMSQMKDSFETAKASDSAKESQSKESGINLAKIDPSLKSKVASEAMRPADVAIGKNRNSANGNSEQKGTKELSFDQARLAGTVNFDSISRPSYGMIDGPIQL